MSIPFFFIVIAAFASHFHLASALPLVVGRDDTNSSGNLGSAVSGSGTSHIVEAAIIAFLVLSILCLITVHLFRRWSVFSKHIRWMFCCGSSPSTVPHSDRHVNVPAAGHIPAPHLSRTMTSDSSSSTLTSSSAATAVDIDLQELPKTHCPKKACYDVPQTLQK